MAEIQNIRPPAPREREESATQLFPLEMSPEEYAARHGADWGSFSFADYSYADARLDAWIQKLWQIFQTPGRLSECQERFLTPAELKEVRDRMNDPF